MNLNRRTWLQQMAAMGSAPLVLPGLASAAGAPAAAARVPRLGVNCFDLFYGPLVQPKAVRPPAVRLREMADQGIPFVRFAASPFWPNEWRQFTRNRTRMQDLLDELFEAAASTGVELVPSLVWGPAYVSDMVGERVSAWGQPRSATAMAAKEHVTAVVSRYAKSRQVLFWEFGNEFNSALDQRDQGKWWPKVNAAMGTPEQRTPEDSITTAQYQSAVTQFCEWVASAAPGAARGTGADRPHPGARHLARGERGVDLPPQFRQSVQAANPTCAEWASLHLYPDGKGAYFGRTSNAVQVLTEAKAAAREAGQKLFLGEFGVPDKGSKNDQREQFSEFLEAIDIAQVDLAALWVYDFHYQPEFTVTPTNERAWQLRAIVEWNERMRKRGPR